MPYNGVRERRQTHSLLRRSTIDFTPGIFVALALRFDVSRGKEPQYFKSAFLGYTVGLVLTIIVMNWFQAAHNLNIQVTN